MMPEPLSTIAMDAGAPSKHSAERITTTATVSTVDQLQMQSGYICRVSTPPGIMTHQSGVGKQVNPPRDSSWLELEPCREYLKDSCPRGDACRFAHPPRAALTDGGKVTCCYDFLKDRCHREHCKYFHPPPHIKDRLVAAGKQFGAMMSGFYGMPLMGASPLQVSAGVPQLLASPAYQYSSDKVHICPDYLVGQCHQQLCQLAHPEHFVRRSPDGTVTICRDYIRSTGCPREQCRFYHPPPHILESCTLSQPGFVTPQGLFMPALLSGGYHHTAPMFYQPSASPYTPTSGTTIPTSTFMYLPPGSFPPVSGMSPQMYVPANYHSGPLMPSGTVPFVPTPYQSISASPPPVSVNPTHSQTILSVQAIHQ